jgi:Common central domain of tyrosinase
MHHEMVKATTTEQHFHMLHESLVDWYQQQRIGLPSLWDPMQPIPTELGYTADPTVFPEEIQRTIRNWAQQEGVSVEQFLTRSTNNPRFAFPQYFTREGVDPGDPGEPITAARKLADFRNTNQLGCCLVYPHNEWHGTIGGAMGTTWTAIADPIFYWGVHWYVDRIFDEYKSIQAEREIRPFDRSRLSELHALESERIEVPEEFSPEQKAWLERQIQLSQQLNRWE